MMDFDAAIELVRRQGAGLVAIDGLPVSGKSTLAGRLESELGASVLYLDDFVRPAHEWRGISAPAFPIPYIRYDQFMTAIAELAAGRLARFQRYDWESGRLSDEWHSIDPRGIVVVEGVSALHAELAPHFELRFWVNSDAATTLEATLDRGVGDWERDWRELFLPSVELYLASDPRQRADYCVAGRGAMP